MASAADVPRDAFEVEHDDGVYILNHPNSQTWSQETREAVEAAALTVLPSGSRVSLR